MYVERKEGRSILVSIEDCVDVATEDLKEYAKQNNERLNTTAKTRNKNNTVTND